MAWQCQTAIKVSKCFLSISFHHWPVKSNLWTTATLNSTAVDGAHYFLAFDVLDEKLRPHCSLNFLLV